MRIVRTLIAFVASYAAVIVPAIVYISSQLSGNPNKSEKFESPPKRPISIFFIALMVAVIVACFAYFVDKSDETKETTPMTVAGAIEETKTVETAPKKISLLSEDDYSIVEASSTYNGDGSHLFTLQSNDNALVFETLDKAIASNWDAHPLFHSDRGFQYTSRTFHAKLEAAGMTQSMSRVAHCIDNGPMEGFWGILKRERYYGRRFTSKEELMDMICTYIDYYNNCRVQRNLGILTPMEKHQQFLFAA